MKTILILRIGKKNSSVLCLGKKNSKWCICLLTGEFKRNFAAKYKPFLHYSLYNIKNSTHVRLFHLYFEESFREKKKEFVSLMIFLSSFSDYLLFLFIFLITEDGLNRMMKCRAFTML